MATANKPETGKNLVKIRLFKDNHDYKDDVFVGVNGEHFLIQRGVEVEVPDYVAEVLHNSELQDIEAAAKSEAAQRNYEEKSKE